MTSLTSILDGHDGINASNSASPIYTMHMQHAQEVLSRLYSPADEKKYVADS